MKFDLNLEHDETKNII